MGIYFCPGSDGWHLFALVLRSWSWLGLTLQQKATWKQQLSCQDWGLSVHNCRLFDSSLQLPLVQFPQLSWICCYCWHMFWFKFAFCLQKVCLHDKKELGLLFSKRPQVLVPLLTIFIAVYLHVFSFLITVCAQASISFSTSRNWEWLSFIFMPFSSQKVNKSVQHFRRDVWDFRWLLMVKHSKLGHPVLFHLCLH